MSTVISEPNTIGLIGLASENIGGASTLKTTTDCRQSPRQTETTIRTVLGYNNDNNESLLYSAILQRKLLDSQPCSTTRNHSSYLAPWMTPPPTPSHTNTPVTIVPVQKAPYSPHYPVIVMQSV